MSISSASASKGAHNDEAATVPSTPAASTVAPGWGACAASCACSLVDGRALTILSPLGLDEAGHKCLRGILMENCAAQAVLACHVVGLHLSIVRIALLASKKSL